MAAIMNPEYDDDDIESGIDPLDVDPLITVCAVSRAVLA